MFQEPGRIWSVIIAVLLMLFYLVYSYGYMHGAYQNGLNIYRYKEICESQERGNHTYIEGYCHFGNMSSEYAYKTNNLIWHGDYIHGNINSLKWIILTGILPERIK